MSARGAVKAPGLDDACPEADDPRSPSDDPRPPSDDARPAAGGGHVSAGAADTSGPARARASWLVSFAALPVGFALGWGPAATGDGLALGWGPTATGDGLALGWGPAATGDELALVSGSTTRGRSAVPDHPSDLQSLVDAEMARFPGEAGVWIKHLTTGEEVGVRADDTFNSASVIKLTVLALAFELSVRGELSLDERVTIRPEDMRGGSGVFRRMAPGLQPTWRDVLTQMVITSDNTATDLAIARVGGVARVNQWIEEHDLGSRVRLTQTTGDLFAAYAALPEGADRNERTASDPAFWLGEMTPRGTGWLLEGIARWTLTTPESGDEMIGMMRAQLSGARRLPHFISVPVAHKTGDFSPVLANDVGIIYSRSGPIIVAFFANAIRGPYSEAEDRIGRLAQRVVDYFDGATPPSALSAAGASRAGRASR